MSINRFPIFKFGPLTNITPFTYSDGVTYLSVLRRITDYLSGELAESLQEFVAGVDDRILRDREDMEKALGEFIANVEERFDALAADAAVEAVNLYLADPATVDLAVSLKMADPDSKTYSAAEQTVAGWIGGEESPVRDAANSAIRDEVSSDISNENSDIKKLMNTKFVRLSENPVIFVDSTRGNDQSAGTESEPFKTIQRAVNKATELPYLDGEIIIRCAAGVYPEAVVFPDSTGFPVNIAIEGAPTGGHPAVPYTVISLGDNYRGSGIINRNREARIRIKDVRISGFNGSASSYGINNEAGEIRTDNVHAINCHVGISSFNGVLRVPDGIIDNCTYGFRSMMNNRHIIGRQLATDTTNQLIVRNTARGGYISENSTGHVDYVNFLNCERALQIEMSSRVNANGSKFEDCVIGAYVGSGSHVYIPENCTVTNVDALVMTVAGGRYLAPGRATSDSGYDPYLSRSQIFTKAVYNPVTINSANAEFFRMNFKPEWFSEKFRLFTLPAKKIRLESLMNVDGPGFKTITVRACGRSFNMALDQTETGAFKLTVEILFVSPEKQIITAFTEGNRGTDRMNITVNETVNTSDVIRLLGSGDADNTITVHCTEVSVIE